MNTDSDLKYSVTSTSLVPKTSALSPESKVDPVIVYYTPLAHHKIRLVVSKCQKEVGWLGIVDVVEGGYLIKDIFVPKQTVSSVETDIDANAIIELAMSLDNPDEMYYWGHSHVNMAVRPSSQDEDQVNEFLEGCPVFIRGIYNKAGDSKVDVYDKKTNTIHECVVNRVALPPQDPEVVEAFEKVIESNVILAAVTPNNPYAGYQNSAYVYQPHGVNPFITY